LILFFSF